MTLQDSRNPMAFVFVSCSPRLTGPMQPHCQPSSLVAHRGPQQLHAIKFVFNQISTENQSKKKKWRRRESVESEDSVDLAKHIKRVHLTSQTSFIFLSFSLSAQTICPHFCFSISFPPSRAFPALINHILV